VGQQQYDNHVPFYILHGCITHFKHRVLQIGYKNSVLRNILRKQPLFFSENIKNTITISGVTAKLYVNTGIGID
jgi:hypothetical protein